MARLGSSGDRLFRWLTLAMALSIFALILLIGFELTRSSRLSLHRFGWHFLFSSDWDPVNEHFGALPFIFGTLVSSLIALVIAVPLSIATALFLTELVGAVILGLGRALGETMAVTMVIGNRPDIAHSLLAPGYTLASVIANEFAEATTDIYLSTLFEVGLVLLAVTMLVNALAQLLIKAVAGPARTRPA